MLPHHAHPSTAGGTLTTPARRAHRPTRAADLVVAPLETPPPAAAAPSGQCLRRSTTQIACAENASCVCPLSGHVSDRERAVMNGIARQAAQLRTVLVWLFALAALAALVLLMMR